jgi:hypothetical protein
MEELNAGGEAMISERFGPFTSGDQIPIIRGKIAAEAASAKKEHETRNERRDENQEEDFENFAQSAREAPVFGGTLNPDERESMARACRKNLESSKSRYDDWRVSFFYLEDINGDGERDALMGIAGDIYLMRGDRAFMLGQRMTNYRKSHDASRNKMVISSDGQRVIKNRWDMLQIDGSIFFVEPGDIKTIESF